MTNPTRTRRLTEGQYSVLGLLTLGERSGYELSKLAEHNVDLILAPTKSRIYAVLPELLQAGYVSRREVEQQRRPDKQLYSLTAEGRTAIEAWLNDTTKLLHRDQLLLKLFFGDEADPRALLEQVQHFRSAKADEHSRLSGYAEENRKSAGDRFFRNLTLTCGLDLARAQIDWADRAARALKTRIRTQRPRCVSHRCTSDDPRGTTLPRDGTSSGRRRDDDRVLRRS